MSEIITPEDTGEPEVIRFPELRFLSIDSLHVLESFYKGKSKLEFPKLEELELCNVRSMKSFANSEKSLALFHENIDFPCLDTLKVRDMPEVNAQWDSQADRGSVMSNPAPMFKAEDYNGVEALAFCGQLKTLMLAYLPTLKLIPLNLFKGLESLTLYGLEWEYVVSAAALVNSLQQLQFLTITGCENMGAVVIDVVTSIELPRLKELRLLYLGSIKSFSSTTNGEATLRLPSLESLYIWECPALEHFWSGSIVGNTEDVIEFPSLQQVYIRHCSNMKSISVGPLNAPKLRNVNLEFCASMECFLPENPNHSGVLQLSSLEAVDIKECPKLHSFSFTPLEAPKLTHVTYNFDDYSMLAYNNLNHFLKEMLAKPRDEEEDTEEEDI